MDYFDFMNGKGSIPGIKKVKYTRDTECKDPKLNSVVKLNSRIDSGQVLRIFTALMLELNDCEEEYDSTLITSSNGVAKNYQTPEEIAVIDAESAVVNRCALDDIVLSINCDSDQVFLEWVDDSCWNDTIKGTDYSNFNIEDDELFLIKRIYPMIESAISLPLSLDLLNAADEFYRNESEENKRFRTNKEVFEQNAYIITDCILKALNSSPDGIVLIENIHRAIGFDCGIIRQALYKEEFDNERPRFVLRSLNSICLV